MMKSLKIIILSLAFTLCITASNDLSEYPVMTEEDRLELMRFRANEKRIREEKDAHVKEQKKAEKERKELERLKEKERAESDRKDLERLRKQEKEEQAQFSKISLDLLAEFEEYKREKREKARKESEHTVTSTVTLYTLTIIPTPSNARIQITNIKPRYRNGIQLRKGSYKVKVSKAGYKTAWFTVRLHKDVSRKIDLKKIQTNNTRNDVVPDTQKKVVRSNSGTGGWKHKNYPSGEKYYGEFKHGKRHGQGKYTWLNGGTYSGTWKNNIVSGKGTYVWSNGNKYVGSWVNGKQSGLGTYKWRNGNSYVGNWRNDALNGKGTYKWRNGNKYVGNFVNNQRTGQGTFTWSNGDRYVGTWKNNKRNGRGTYIWFSGKQSAGIWSNNVLIGQ